MAKVISVYNIKKGVGKTFITYCLSTYAAFKGYKVLAIDLNYQPNLTEYLFPQILEFKIPGNISMLFADESKARNIYSIIFDTNIPNLKIIPSTLELAKYDVYKGWDMESDTKLKRLLEPIKDQYDLILIDNSPSLNIFTRNSLLASDSVIIPIVPAKVITYNLQLLHDFLSMAIEHNLDLKIAALVPNLIDMRYKLHKHLLSFFSLWFEGIITKHIGKHNLYNSILNNKINFYNILKTNNVEPKAIENIQDLIEVMDELLKKVFHDRHDINILDINNTKIQKTQNCNNPATTNQPTQNALKLQLIKLITEDTQFRAIETRLLAYFVLEGSSANALGQRRLGKRLNISTNTVANALKKISSELGIPMVATGNRFNLLIDALYKRYSQLKNIMPFE
ncbi:ParA family protein [Thermosipho melanesiensis]|uniref:Cobyrinic acid a,c-diamide synthase n=2 Tax=Thermosipho melanesiensis TaxID=46541 RepID=A6LK14_THEM4|nr:AAA family ATPase [Thermosipho melanesiensis]ABR30265.1 Cobyrinic acid a,c-diamide synthase [Thermosipho melanesiensis BI429]APT73448.1 sporulation initiation inhibitor Soj [Thermosipho melanesiensis]